MSFFALETDVINNFEFPDQGQQQALARSVVGFAGVLAAEALAQQANYMGIYNGKFNPHFKKKSTGTDNPKVWIQATYPHRTQPYVSYTTKKGGSSKAAKYPTVPPYLFYSLAKQPRIERYASIIAGETRGGIHYKTAKAATKGFRSSYITATKTNEYETYWSKSKKTGEWKQRKRKVIRYDYTDQYFQESSVNHFYDWSSGKWKSSGPFNLGQNKPQWEDWMRRTWNNKATGYVNVINKHAANKFNKMMRIKSDD